MQTYPRDTTANKLAMSTLFVSSRRDGGRTAPSPPPPATTVTPVARDWAALPSDIVFDVFLRLGPFEVMLGAEQVCKPWRRVAVEEPKLWRRAGLDSPDYSDERRPCYRVRQKMSRVAVNRAKGQCEAFKGSCNDHDLLRLVRREPSLKSLSIEHHNNYPSGWEYLVKALKKLSLLEDLEIDFEDAICWDKNMLQSVCKACPRLKKLVMVFNSAFDLECNEDEFDKEPIKGPIPMMRKLRTLKLYDCGLTCEGLNAILDGCPRLENLFIEGYFDKREMNKELKLKCARVKNLILDTRTNPPYCGYLWDEFDYSTEEDSDISSQEEDYVSGDE